MQTGLVPTSGQPDTPSEIIRQGLVRFSEICNKDITPELVSIWISALSDIPVGLLKQAFRELERTWVYDFLPKPGNVRELIRKSDEEALHLEAEQAWKTAFDYARRFGNKPPEYVWEADEHGMVKPREVPPPELDAKVEFCLWQVGGPHHLEACAEDELQWAQKRFREVYLNVEQTDRAQHLLSRSAAKKILEQLKAGPARAATPALDPPYEPPSDAPQEVRDKLKEIAGTEPPIPEPMAYVPPTDDEWERAKARLAAQDEVLRKAAGKTSEEWAQMKAEAKKKVG